MNKKEQYPSVTNLKESVFLFVRNRKVQSLFFILFYVLLSATKSRTFLIDGRFWAEDGAIFYPGVQNDILFLFNGHLELMTNITVYFSTLVELKYAPLVTSYLSFTFQAIPIVMLIAFRDQFEIKRLALFVIIIIVVGLPQSSEVWANAANLHFHFALLVALIAALPFFDRYPKNTMRGFLILSGLSGIPANFLMPIYCLRLVLVKDNEARIQAAILISTTIIQLTFLFYNFSPSGARSISLEPVHVMLAITAQQFVSPLLGSEAAESITLTLRAASSLNSQFWMLLGLIVATVLLVYKKVVFSGVSQSVILSVCGLCLASASITTALGDKIDFISPWNHGRYLYAPNVLFFISLGMIVSVVKQRLLLVLFCLVGIASGVYGLKSLFYGPNWAEA